LPSTAAATVGAIVATSSRRDLIATLSLAAGPNARADVDQRDARDDSAANHAGTRIVEVHDCDADTPPSRHSPATTATVTLHGRRGERLELYVRERRQRELPLCCALDGLMRAGAVSAEA
jgi:hypothetical protein